MHLFIYRYSRYINFQQCINQESNNIFFKRVILSAIHSLSKLFISCLSVNRSTHVCGAVVFAQLPAASQAQIFNFCKFTPPGDIANMWNAAALAGISSSLQLTSLQVVVQLAFKSAVVFLPRQHELKGKSEDNKWWNELEALCLISFLVPIAPPSLHQKITRQPTGTIKSKVGIQSV